VSTGLKITLVLVALAVGALFYLNLSSQRALDVEISPHQSLEELRSTGQVEVKSFEQWQKERKQATGAQGERFKAWRAEQLKKKSEAAQEPNQEPNPEPSPGSNPEPSPGPSAE
jgi:hypothetical protein